MSKERIVIAAVAVVTLLALAGGFGASNGNADQGQFHLLVYDFFDKTIGITPWTMSLLTTNKPMLFLGASCGSADYARTEKASGRPPIAEEFLLEPSKGAVAWIGPTAGTWQNGNEAVVTCLIDALYANPDQPMRMTATSACCK